MTTAETLVNYFLNVQDYRPDVVVLLHAVNDAMPRGQEHFRRDYSHFRRPWVDYDVGLLERPLLRYSDLYASLRLEFWETDGIVEHVDRAPLGERDFIPGRLLANTGGPYERNLHTVLDHARRHGGRGVLLTMPHDPEPSRWEGFEHHALRLEGLLEHNEIARTLAAREGHGLIDLARRLELSLIHISEPTRPY